MHLLGAHRVQIARALWKTNEIFDGNIEFKAVEYKGESDGMGFPLYKVTLRVKNSAAAGARRSAAGRRTASACWHAHGAFLDALPQYTLVTTGIPRRRKFWPDERWEDWTVQHCGRRDKISNLCDCVDDHEIWAALLRMKGFQLYLEHARPDRVAPAFA